MDTQSGDYHVFLSTRSGEGVGWGGVGWMGAFLEETAQSKLFLSPF